MSPCEQLIVDHLSGTTDRLANAWELRDAAGLKTESGVRILIHRLRHLRHVAIESRSGPYGGYRLAGAA